MKTKRFSTIVFASGNMSNTSSESKFGWKLIAVLLSLLTFNASLVTYDILVTMLSSLALVNAFSLAYTKLLLSFSRQKSCKASFFTDEEI